MALLSTRVLTYGKAHNNEGLGWQEEICSIAIKDRVLASKDKEICCD